MKQFVIVAALLIGIASASAQNFGAPHGDAGMYYSDRTAWEAKRAAQDAAKAPVPQPYPGYYCGSHDCRLDLCPPYGCVEPSGKK